uniref:Uncharacterized protein n=1 Tax=mine drainage metagenome TaxID=410659 RepID=E6PZ76_9ZZZZ
MATPTSNLVYGKPTVRMAINVDTQQTAVFRTRHISPDAGRAIEMLGHAIEYLADEFALDCMQWKGQPQNAHPALAAIEMLKAKNREVYYACPFAPTLAHKLRTLLHWALDSSPTTH